MRQIDKTDLSFTKRPRRMWLIPVFFACMLVSACADPAKTGGTGAKEPLPYHFASQEEGKKLLVENEEYFGGLTQNELEFKMQKKGASVGEFRKFAGEQILDFAEDEKAAIDESMDRIREKIKKGGYHLPEVDEIVFINSTMKEENNAQGYTHGTQVYLSGEKVRETKDSNFPESLDLLLLHEIFHSLTRCNPDFRKAMYEPIHFTVHEKDYELPPSVREYYISNPDVEHHNSSAEFMIDGKRTECYMAYMTERHFEKEGDRFFDVGFAALIPTDGSDTYFRSDEASNLNEVFGNNTSYVIDPEEAMADNFAFAIHFGEEGPGGMGYATPEIIHSIVEYLQSH